MSDSEQHWFHLEFPGQLGVGCFLSCLELNAEALIEREETKRKHAIDFAEGSHHVDRGERWQVMQLFNFDTTSRLFTWLAIDKGWVGTSSGTMILSHKQCVHRNPCVPQ